jgi:3-deoxy-D-manno-octulosonic-acid transferase
MALERTPLLLLAWMLVTRFFAIPILALSWVLHRRMGADPKRFSERLGCGALQDSASVVWFHAASLGEVMQIAPLVQHLIMSENVKILVTTTTATGADWVAREMPYVTHRFSPIDTPKVIERFLDGWSISAAIFVEGDLWPQLLAGLHKRGVKRILLNARHSRTRARFPNVFAVLLRPFVLVTCRSKRVAEELDELGLAPDRLHILPDLRLALPKLAAPHHALALLSQAVGTRPVWLAASTHPADEEVVLAAHQKVLEARPDSLLIIAPRHLNRGLPLQKLMQSRALTAVRRSLGKDITVETQVYIADTLGELGVFFALSPIAFLGGSFGKEGGHNPYEPICFETAVLHGPNVKNFNDAYESLQKVGAAEQVDDAAHLGRVIVRLQRSDEAKRMGLAGSVFKSNEQDCTSSYAKLIADTLSRREAVQHRQQYPKEF